MRRSVLICFSLFLAGIALGLIQLWFEVLSPQIFFKIIVTDIAFFTVSFLWAFLVKETSDSRKIHNGNSLD